MITVNSDEAKAPLSELLDRVEGGIVTRRDKAVAHIHPPEAPKRPLRNLTRFRAGMPGWGGASAAALRDLRDEDL